MQVQIISRFLETQVTILCMAIHLWLKLTSSSMSQLTDFNSNTKLFFCMLYWYSTKLDNINIHKNTEIATKKIVSCPYSQSLQKSCYGYSDVLLCWYSHEEYTPLRNEWGGITFHFTPLFLSGNFCLFSFVFVHDCSQHQLPQKCKSLIVDKFHISLHPNL